MPFFVLAMLFVAAYLFFETLNLIVGNKEKMLVKRLMFVVTSVSISLALFYLVLLTTY